jgi:cation diffusion facilitator family transporter
MDLDKSAKISRKAFAVIFIVAISEIFLALFSRSVSLLADGIHSISTAVILFIVWVGLRLSRRSPDGTFHFGYYRIQTLASLIAAVILAGFGVVVLFESYSAWLEYRVIAHAEAAITAALLAAIIVIIISLWIKRASEKYSSTALKAGELGLC